MDVFFQIGLIIILAGLGAYIAKITKQPLVPAYILAGIVITHFVGVSADGELISNLSEIGIAFLLFMVGLELEFKKLRDIGKSSALVGVVQVVLVFISGYAATRLLGFTSREAIYLGIVIAFSSTMIVIKLLSDKFEINTLHGRLIIGILVVQDILAIIALSYLESSAGQGFDVFFFRNILAVTLIAVILGKYVFPSVFEFAAKSQELLLASSLAVCFLFALMFNSIGLSIAIGSFVAGVLLANLPYNVEIVGKVKSLRDFFVILFFTSLGLQLQFDGIVSLIPAVIVLFLIVVLLKPLILYAALLVGGNMSKTSFLTAASLAQISEFSLIVVSQGVSMGVLSNDILALTILLAVITMSLTSYFVRFENKVYHEFIRLLRKLKVKVKREHHIHKDSNVYDAIMCGYDRIGYSILNNLMAQKKKVFIVDFNPDVVKRLNSMNIPCMYGDIADQEVLDRLNLKNAEFVISTANIYEDNLLLLKKTRQVNPSAVLVLTAHNIDEALELYKHHADYVILPHFLGGTMVGQLLARFDRHKSREYVDMIKEKHISDLLQRKNWGQHHPNHRRAIS